MRKTLDDEIICRALRLNGARLDSLAADYKIERRRGETDEQLRKRLLQTIRNVMNVAA